MPYLAIDDAIQEVIKCWSAYWHSPSDLAIGTSKGAGSSMEKKKEATKQAVHHLVKKKRKKVASAVEAEEKPDAAAAAADARPALLAQVGHRGDHAGQDLSLRSKHTSLVAQRGLLPSRTLDAGLRCARACPRIIRGLHRGRDLHDAGAAQGLRVHRICPFHTSVCLHTSRTAGY